MANYDGHPAVKRQRTDGDSSGQRTGQPTFYNYSTNQRASRGNGDEEKANHILLMTVLNPAYPITVSKWPSSQGSYLQEERRPSYESAKRAKQSLHGADIYSGCCTLKIEYAKPSRLNVYKNDTESWDYTNPNLNKNPERPGPLLQEPRFGSAPTPYRNDQNRGPPGSYGTPERAEPYDGGYNNSSGGSSGRFAQQYSPYQQDHYCPPQDRYGAPSESRYNSRSENYDGRSSEGPTGLTSRYGSQTSSATNAGPQQGAVMMVYGLNHEKINADRIFNLFCLYGNVVRVKFLKSKEGCAMVQMGDGAAVERAIQNLNNSVFFGNKMQLGFSKQAFLNDVQQPFELPDGSPSFKDFMGNRNNRFTNPEAASKNRIQPPSKVLHFFNTPSGISEEELKKQVFEEQGVNPPKSVKLFASKNQQSERSSSGLLEWDNISEALEALVTTNHTPIPNPNGKFPYILKLCFSSSGPLDFTKHLFSSLHTSMFPFSFFFKFVYMFVHCEQKLPCNCGLFSVFFFYLKTKTSMFILKKLFKKEIII
uniref:RRM domain-containing protein n=1 Tax=Strigamia maritima TaxID=126957 RepID=T1IPR9_STRMM